jgi:methyltransferase-like protein/SAM-dependent methyltransferase
VTSDVASSYEQIPYTSYPFVEAHPNRMATVAALFGLSPPPVPRARVLELGCAAGDNLIPMAASLPEGRFVGIDQSPRQVAQGMSTIRAVGLKNIELRKMSILEVGPDLGTFDYIICHGVYSWVPANVQDKILAICSQSLAKSGVALVSYNIYPGWHLRGILREAMLFHAGEIPDPQARLKAARGFLDFMAQYVWDPNGAFAAYLREQRERLAREPDAYLFHEFLEEVNQPLYFHEFLERATAQKLKHIGDARLRSMACAAPEPSRAALGGLTPNVLRQEEYLDFLRCRTFRRTLLCHADVEVRPAPLVEAVEGLQAAVSVAPGAIDPQIRPNVVESFRTADGKTVVIDHPAIKAALLILGEQWPRAIPFRSLWPDVTSRLSRAGISIALQGQADRQRLAGFLLEAHSAGWLELHSHMPHMVREPGERPATTPLVRHQASTSSRVSNLRHQPVELKRFDRHLVGLLDGLRTHPALVDALNRLVEEGALSITGTGPGPLDPVAQRSIVADSVRQGLARLAGNALLVG